MPDINPSVPIIGQSDSTEEPKVVTALTQLIAAVNNVDTDQIADGTIVAADLASALADVLGINAGGTTRRGKLNIPTEELVSGASYTLAATPDKITVTLPTDGLIFLVYQAVVKANDVTAEAAIFLGDNQVKGNAPVSGAAQPVDMSVGVSTGNLERALVTTPHGLVLPNGVGWTEPTTGLLVSAAAVGGNPAGINFNAGGSTISWSNESVAIGGPAIIMADAGTYDVSIKFKGSTGVTVSKRHMWAWAIGF